MGSERRCCSRLTHDPESEFGKPGFKWAACCGKTTSECGFFCPMFDSVNASGPGGSAMVFTHPGTWCIVAVGMAVNIYQIYLFSKRGEAPGDCYHLELFYFYGGLFGLLFLPFNALYLALFCKQPGAPAVHIIALLVAVLTAVNIVWWVLGNIWFWRDSTEEECGVLYTDGKVAMIILDCIPVIAIPFGCLVFSGEMQWPWCCTRMCADPPIQTHVNEPGRQETVKRIGVMYFDGGTAHRIAAHALRDVLQQQPELEGADVQLVDAYVDVFKFNDTFCRHLGSGMEAFNDALKYERVTWLWLWMRLARMSHDNILNERCVQAMSAYFELNHYDLFISTIPLYNEMVFRALRRVCPDAITVVLPVDFKECIRRYWFSPRSPTDHYIVFNDTLAEQARRSVPEARCHRIGGMVLPPQFYQKKISGDERAAAKRELGLPSDKPVGLVSFGGQGSMIMVDIARMLDGVEREFSMIYVCGRNEEAKVAIESMDTKHSKVVLGFTKEMPRMMSLSDFFIGKPGPTSIHEAIAAGTPAILFKAQGMAFLLGSNEVWFTESGLGLIIKDIKGLVEAARTVLDDPSFKERIAAAFHRGVFDCAKIVVEDIITHQRLPRPPSLPAAERRTPEPIPSDPVLGSSSEGPCQAGPNPMRPAL
eukprot:TRINITY_DN2442_c0_g1_i1.p1 TRINITY_DN2442_c0_g1~~TRINITY_DN2442_c0_g1_i1.p1  ORF type:complete len:671 (+),score=227.07 TRINITY_DN2442_c0_g1_i1:69-2015(+)